MTNGPQTVDIAFSVVPGPGQYVVSFDEAGLPTGTSWGVTLNGTNLASSSAWINFTEVNGSLSFEVGSVPGYTANPSSGSVDVKGAGVSRPITFTTAQNTSTSPQAFLGLPVIEGYALLGGIVLLVVVGVVGAIMYRRRRKASPDAVASAPPPGAGGAGPPP